ncbi:protein kinase [Planctomycetota bacterium]|nr:protein kinase [Planctomycetota bacterium]
MFQKGLISAVVAVRAGRLMPEVAAELIQNTPDDDELFSKITAAAIDDVDTDDPFSGGTVAIAPMNVESIISALKAGDVDTAPFGMDAAAQDSLARLQAIDDQSSKTAIMDTLLAIVPKSEIGSQDETMPARSVTTMRPSTRSLEKLGSPDRYKIKKEHARGGMGRILVARDNVVGREVALKELLKGNDGGMSVPPGSVESQGIEERFLREAKVTGQLEHPNIVPVYEIGKSDDGSVYYTMKFVHGITMSRHIKNIAADKQLTKSEKLAARIRMLDGFTDVCNAIAYAHSKGVIHRDLKPDNIMLGEFGETVVLDWGLARVHGQDDSANDLANKSRAISDSLWKSDGANLTLDGSVVGTPAYMAPEQARGSLDEIDEQTDVYALGAVLYQLLSGRPPYEGPSAGLIVQQVLAGPPLRLKAFAPDIPPELVALVERAMAHTKSERFTSARELASEVQAFRDGRALASYNYSTRESLARWVKRHKAPVLTAALALSIIITGSVFAFVELRKEKQAAEHGHASALDAQAEAEASWKVAKSESLAASQARAKAETEAIKAAEAAKRASDAESLALVEAGRSKDLLGKLRYALAEDYAVRVQVSQGQGDYNAAYAYASACLKQIDNPYARGAVMSDGQVIPRVWRLEPDEKTTQDIYEFYSLAVSADSNFVATGTQGGDLYIWNLRTGERHQTLKLEGTLLFGVAFHPVEMALVAATATDQIVKFRLNPATDKFEQDGAVQNLGRERVTSMEFSPDGKTLALGGDRLLLTHWPSLKVYSSPVTEDYRPMIVRFSADGKRISTTSLLPSLALGDATIWDISTGELSRRTIPSNRWELFSAWSPDGIHVATASFGGEVTVRKADKMASKGMVLRGHTSSVFQVSYSPSGKYIASASADGTVRLWGAKTGGCIAVLSGFPAWVQSAVFNPGETLLILRDVQGRVSVWDIRDLDRNTVRVHNDDVIDVSYNEDGSLVATASIDGHVQLISTKTREIVQTLGLGVEPILSVSFLPGTNRIIAASMRGLHVYEYGSNQAKIERPIQVVAENKTILATNISSDGRRFAYVQYQKLHVHDSKTLEPAWEAKIDGFALSCAFSPDGKEIAVGCRDGTVVLCSESDSATRTLNVSSKSAFSVDYSPDGKLLAVTTETDGLLIIDMATHETLKALDHPGTVFGVDFGHDGKLLVTACQDRLVRVFDTATWKVLAILSGPESVATRVAIHPSGVQVVAGSQDDTVRFWSLKNLTADRKSLLRIAEGKTGLTVDDESLLITQMKSWPMEDGQVSSVVKSVRARTGLDLERAARDFVDRYEEFRYEDVDGNRRYLPARRRDAFGNFAGEPMGKIDHVSWYLSQLEAPPPSMFWRKAFVTETTDGGQAQSGGLQAGDVIWTVNGNWISSKDTLLEAMKSKGGSYEMVVRRFKRDVKGRLVSKKTENGSYVLDEKGELQWEFTELKVEFKEGKMGAKVNYDVFLKRPFHQPSK